MKIACIMMQKNENELLDSWFNYHASMFEANNIYILDNGSTNPSVLSSLQRIESLGATIITKYNTNLDYELKGEILGDLINSLDEQEYDFFIPLDCDEFIATFDKNGKVSCDKNDITDELSKHVNSKDALVIAGQLFNCPLSNTHFHFQKTRKTFFTKDSFKSLDQGYHWGKSISLGEHATNITHFHFHNKPFDILLEHSREKLKSRVASFDPEYLKTYDGMGSHMVRYFLINEEEYLSQFEQISYTETSSLYNALKECHAKMPYEASLPIDFNSKGYIDNITFNEELLKIRITGWAYLKDKKLSSFIIRSNGEDVSRVDISDYIVRQDVASYLNIKNNSLGFDVDFNLNPEQINNLKVIPVYSNDIRGKPLIFNGAAHSFVSKYNHNISQC